MVPNSERTSQFDKSKKEKTAVSPPVPKYVLPIPQKIHWVQDTGVLVVQKLRQITNQSSSASVRLLHALFYEKDFLLVSCKILEQLYASSTDIKAARFRAGRTHTACATIDDAVCFKRFTKVLPWSCLEQDVENATWRIVSGTAACGCHLEIRFGSRDKREDSVRFKEMIASGWDGLWARWRDRL
jgi:hypothetical protein